MDATEFLIQNARLVLRDRVVENGWIPDHGIGHIIEISMA